MAKAPRSYGNGSLYKRGDTWHCAYMFNGEQQRESTGEKDRTKAQNYLRAKLGQISRGELVRKPEKSKSNGRITVGEVLDWYLDQRPNLAGGTLRAYESQVELHLRPDFGDLSVSALTYQLFEQYRKKRSSENVIDPARRGLTGRARTGRSKVTPTSINRELGLLRSALNGYRKTTDPTLPSLSFPMESEKGNVRHGYMTEKELGVFLGHLPIYLRALIACAFYCGGRTSEWLQLDWEDIDFENGTVYFRETKNKNPREVPIWEGSLMEEWLRKLKVSRDAQWPEQQAVFTETGTSRLTTFVKSFKTAAAKIGKTGLNPHDMRRSANRWMRLHNVDQLTRMYIMGHRTASMDIRYGTVDREVMDHARTAVLDRIKENRRKALTGIALAS